MTRLQEIQNFQNHIYLAYLFVLHRKTQSSENSLSFPTKITLKTILLHQSYSYLHVQSHSCHEQWKLCRFCPFKGNTMYLQLQILNYKMSKYNCKPKGDIQCLHLLCDLGIYQNYCHYFLIIILVERSHFTPVPSSPLWNLAHSQHVINFSTFESVEWFTKYLSYKGNLYYTGHSFRYTHKTGFHE